MGKFVGGTRLSKDDIERARNIDTVNLISQRTGWSFVRTGSEWHCRQHDSLVVWRDRKGWNWYSQGKEGKSALDYLMTIEGLGFQDAVCEIVTPEHTYSPPKQTEIFEKPKELQLPPKAKNNIEVVQYLVNTRCIDNIIVQRCLNEGIIYQDERNNCVFVGRDTLTGEPKYAARRGTYTKADGSAFKRECAGSNKSYGFVLEGAEGAYQEHVFVFEAPIDALSHATLNIEKAKGMHRDNWQTSWLNHSRLALGGTADNALRRYLEVHPRIKTISFCLDNDNAGKTASEKYRQLYADKGYKVNVYYVPEGYGKDYNEYLCKFTEIRNQRLRQQAARRTQLQGGSKIKI